jgi:hypothetical protein
MAIEMTEYSDRDRAFHEAGHAVLAAAGIDEAQGRQMFTDGRERAHRLLADAGTWRRVEAVATALLAEGTLDGRRFRDIMAGA